MLLIEKRKELGIGVDRLSQLTKIPASILRRYESGYNRLDLAPYMYVYPLCMALDISFTEYYTYSMSDTYRQWVKQRGIEYHEKRGY